jgi:hypothetical protein
MSHPTTGPCVIPNSDCDGHTGGGICADPGLHVCGIFECQRWDAAGLCGWDYTNGRECTGEPARPEIDEEAVCHACRDALAADQRRN